jgi:hypothetical protein
MGRYYYKSKTYEKNVGKQLAIRSQSIHFSDVIFNIIYSLQQNFIFYIFYKWSPKTPSSLLNLTLGLTDSFLMVSVGS